MAARRDRAKGWIVDFVFEHADGTPADADDLAPAGRYFFDRTDHMFHNLKSAFALSK